MDAQESREETKRTYISVYGALIAAVIGAAIAAGAAIIPGNLQRDATNANVAKQIDAVISNSEREFLRIQRATIYSEYLAAGLNLENTLADCVTIFNYNSSAPKLDTALREAKFAQLRASHAAFTTARFKMQLVYSPEVEVADEPLYDWLHKGFVDLIISGEKNSDNQPSP